MDRSSFAQGALRALRGQLPRVVGWADLMAGNWRMLDRGEAFLLACALGQGGAVRFSSQLMELESTLLASGEAACCTSRCRARSRLPLLGCRQRAARTRRR